MTCRWPLRPSSRWILTTTNSTNVPTAGRHGRWTVGDEHDDDVEPEVTRAQK